MDASNQVNSAGSRRSGYGLYSPSPKLANYPQTYQSQNRSEARKQSNSNSSNSSSNNSNSPSLFQSPLHKIDNSYTSNQTTEQQHNNYNSSTNNNQQINYNNLDQCDEGSGNGGFNDYFNQFVKKQRAAAAAEAAAEASASAATVKAQAQTIIQAGMAFPSANSQTSQFLLSKLQKTPSDMVHHHHSQPKSHQVPEAITPEMTANTWQNNSQIDARLLLVIAHINHYSRSSDTSEQQQQPQQLNHHFGRMYTESEWRQDVELISASLSESTSQTYLNNLSYAIKKLNISAMQFLELRPSVGSTAYTSHSESPHAANSIQLSILILRFCLRWLETLPYAFLTSSQHSNNNTSRKQGCCVQVRTFEEKDTITTTTKFESTFSEIVNEYIHQLKTLTLNNLGTASRAKGSVELAFICYNDCLQVIARYNNKQSSAIANHKSSTATTTAITTSNSSSASNNNYLGLTYLNLSMAYSSIGEHAQSLKNANTALIEQQKIIFEKNYQSYASSSTPHAAAVTATITAAPPTTSIISTNCCVPLLPSAPSSQSNHQQQSQSQSQQLGTLEVRNGMCYEAYGRAKYFYCEERDEELKQQANTLAVCYFNLAAEMEFTGSLDEARRHYASSYECVEKLLGSESRITKQFYSEYQLASRRIAKRVSSNSSSSNRNSNIIGGGGGQNTLNGTLSHHASTILFTSTTRTTSPSGESKPIIFTANNKRKLFRNRKQQSQQLSDLPMQQSFNMNQQSPQKGNSRSAHSSFVVNSCSTSNDRMQLIEKFTAAGSKKNSQNATKSKSQQISLSESVSPPSVIGLSQQQQSLYGVSQTRKLKKNMSGHSSITISHLAQNNNSFTTTTPISQNHPRHSHESKSQGNLRKILGSTAFFDHSKASGAQQNVQLAEIPFKRTNITSQSTWNQEIPQKQQQHLSSMMIARPESSFVQVVGSPNRVEPAASAASTASATTGQSIATIPNMSMNQHRFHNSLNGSSGRKQNQQQSYLQQSNQATAPFSFDNVASLKGSPQSSLLMLDAFKQPVVNNSISTRSQMSYNHSMNSSNSNNKSSIQVPRDLFAQISTTVVPAGNAALTPSNSSSNHRQNSQFNFQRKTLNGIKQTQIMDQKKALNNTLAINSSISTHFKQSQSQFSGQNASVILAPAASAQTTAPTIQIQVNNLMSPSNTPHRNIKQNSYYIGSPTIGVSRKQMAREYNSRSTTKTLNQSLSQKQEELSHQSSSIQQAFQHQNQSKLNQPSLNNQNNNDHIIGRDGIPSEIVIVSERSTNGSIAEVSHKQSPFTSTQSILPLIEEPHRLFEEEKRDPFKQSLESNATLHERQQQQQQQQLQQQNRQQEQMNENPIEFERQFRQAPTFSMNPSYPDNYSKQNYSSSNILIPIEIDEIEDENNGIEKILCHYPQIELVRSSSFDNRSIVSSSIQTSLTFLYNSQQKAIIVHTPSTIDHQVNIIKLLDFIKLQEGQSQSNNQILKLFCEALIPALRIEQNNIVLSSLSSSNDSLDIFVSEIGASIRITEINVSSTIVSLVVSTQKGKQILNQSNLYLLNEPILIDDSLLQLTPIVAKDVSKSGLRIRPLFSTVNPEDSPESFPLEEGIKLPKPLFSSSCRQNTSVKTKQSSIADTKCSEREIIQEQEQNEPTELEHLRIITSTEAIPPPPPPAPLKNFKKSKTAVEARESAASAMKDQMKKQKKSNTIPLIDEEQQQQHIVPEIRQSSTSKNRISAPLPPTHLSQYSLHSQSSQQTMHGGVVGVTSPASLLSRANLMNTIKLRGMQMQQYSLLQMNMHQVRQQFEQLNNQLNSSTSHSQQTASNAAAASIVSPTAATVEQLQQNITYLTSLINSTAPQSSSSKAATSAAAAAAITVVMGAQSASPSTPLSAEADVVITDETKRINADRQIIGTAQIAAVSPSIPIVYSPGGSTIGKDSQQAQQQQQQSQQTQPRNSGMGEKKEVSEGNNNSGFNQDSMFEANKPKFIESLETINQSSEDVILLHQRQSPKQQQQQQTQSRMKIPSLTQIASQPRRLSRFYLEQQQEKESPSSPIQEESRGGEYLMSIGGEKGSNNGVVGASAIMENSNELIIEKEEVGIRLIESKFENSDDGRENNMTLSTPTILKKSFLKTNNSNRHITSGKNTSNSNINNNNNNNNNNLTNQLSNNNIIIPTAINKSILLSPSNNNNNNNNNNNTNVNTNANKSLQPYSSQYDDCDDFDDVDEDAKISNYYAKESALLIARGIETDFESNFINDISQIKNKRHDLDSMKSDDLSQRLNWQELRGHSATETKGSKGLTQKMSLDSISQVYFVPPPAENFASGSEEFSDLEQPRRQSTLSQLRRMLQDPMSHQQQQQQNQQPSQQQFSCSSIQSNPDHNVNQQNQQQHLFPQFPGKLDEGIVSNRMQESEFPAIFITKAPSTSSNEYFDEQDLKYTYYPGEGGDASVGGEEYHTQHIHEDLDYNYPTISDNRSSFSQASSQQQQQQQQQQQLQQQQVEPVDNFPSNYEDARKQILQEVAEMHQQQYDSQGSQSQNQQQPQQQQQSQQQQQQQDQQQPQEQQQQKLQKQGSRDSRIRSDYTSNSQQRFSLAGLKFKDDLRVAMLQTPIPEETSQCISASIQSSGSQNSKSPSSVSASSASSDSESSSSIQSNQASKEQSGVGNSATTPGTVGMNGMTGNPNGIAGGSLMSVDSIRQMSPQKVDSQTSIKRHFFLDFRLKEESTGSAAINSGGSLKSITQQQQHLQHRAVGNLCILNEENRSFTPRIKERRESMLNGNIASFQNQIQIIEQAQAMADAAKNAKQNNQQQQSKFRPITSHQSRHSQPHPHSRNISTLNESSTSTITGSIAAGASQFSNNPRGTSQFGNQNNQQQQQQQQQPIKKMQSEQTVPWAPQKSSLNMPVSSLKLDLNSKESPAAIDKPQQNLQQSSQSPNLAAIKNNNRVSIFAHLSNHGNAGHATTITQNAQNSSQAEIKPNTQSSLSAHNTRTKMFTFDLENMNASLPTKKNKESEKESMLIGLKSKFSNEHNKNSLDDDIGFVKNPLLDDDDDDDDDDD